MLPSIWNCFFFFIACLWWDKRLQKHGWWFMQVADLWFLWLSSTSLQLQSLLRVNVSQVEVDECVHADCRASGGCFTQLSISNSPSLLDSGALSLVSVKVTSVAVCGCAAREMTYRICASYPGNPCLNGGTCTDTKNGYRWAAVSLQFISLVFWGTLREPRGFELKSHSPAALTWPNFFSYSSFCQLNSK